MMLTFQIYLYYSSEEIFSQDTIQSADAGMCPRRSREEEAEEEAEKKKNKVLPPWFSLFVFTINIYIHKLSTAIITNCSPHTSGVSH